MKNFEINLNEADLRVLGFNLSNEVVNEIANIRTFAETFNGKITEIENKEKEVLTLQKGIYQLKGQMFLERGLKMYHLHKMYNNVKASKDLAVDGVKSKKSLYTEIVERLGSKTNSETDYKNLGTIVVEEWNNDSTIFDEWCKNETVNIRTLRTFNTTHEPQSKTKALKRKKLAEQVNNVSNDVTGAKLKKEDLEKIVNDLMTTNEVVQVVNGEETKVLVPIKTLEDIQNEMILENSEISLMEKMQEISEEVGDTPLSFGELQKTAKEEIIEDWKKANAKSDNVEESTESNESEEVITTFDDLIEMLPNVITSLNQIAILRDSLLDIESSLQLASVTATIATSNEVNETVAQ